MASEGAITDICLLARKERAPAQDYVVVRIWDGVCMSKGRRDRLFLPLVQLEQTVGGRKADFAEGVFSAKRFLAYTRRIPSPIWVSTLSSKGMEGLPAALYI